MTREIKAPEVSVLIEKSFDGKHELQFNEKSHRYKLNTKPVVGTTTFIKAAYPTSQGLVNWMMDQAVIFAIASPDDLDGLDLIKAARTAYQEEAQQAADIGTVCHAYAEFHSLGKTEEASKLLDSVKTVEKWPLIQSCILKYISWSDQNKGELVMAERLIASPTHLYCGKFDRLDNVNGKLRLRDYKTSKSIYLDQFIQLAAYKIAIKEWLGLDVEELEVLRFGKEDGEFEPLLISDPKEIQMFEQQAIRCRETYEFTKFNSDPRFDWKKK